MITICKRQYGTDEFKWFYHPMLPQNEKEHFHFFVWVGKRWLIAWPKKYKYDLRKEVAVWVEKNIGAEYVEEALSFDNNWTKSKKER